MVVMSAVSHGVTRYVKTSGPKIGFVSDKSAATRFTSINRSHYKSTIAKVYWLFPNIEFRHEEINYGSRD
jgi:hypothetical protein